jgi:hypothetical protein
MAGSWTRDEVADMKPVRTSAFVDAVPNDGRGRRLPLTSLRLRVRNLFLYVAAEIHCNGMSGRQAAEWLHKKLGRYRECAWRGDRDEERCPPRLVGRVEALMWCVLKCSDRVPGERLIRLVLARGNLPTDYSLPTRRDPFDHR